MKKSIVSGCVVALLLMGLVGCEKKSGDAVVLGKDYVAPVKEGEEIKDERATNNEQCIVKVRMRDNRCTIEVRADQAQWGKLRENNPVKVRYRVGKDVPNAQVHLLDAGHFALDTAADEIAALVRDFLGSSR